MMKIKLKKITSLTLAIMNSISFPSLAMDRIDVPGAAAARRIRGTGAGAMQAEVRDAMVTIQRRVDARTAQGVRNSITIVGPTRNGKSTLITALGGGDLIPERRNSGRGQDGGRGGDGAHGPNGNSNLVPRTEPYAEATLVISKRNTLLDHG